MDDRPDIMGVSGFVFQRTRTLPLRTVPTAVTAFGTTDVFAFMYVEVPLIHTSLVGNIAGIRRESQYLRPDVEY